MDGNKAHFGTVFIMYFVLFSNRKAVWSFTFCYKVKPVCWFPEGPGLSISVPDLNNRWFLFQAWNASLIFHVVEFVDAVFSLTQVLKTCNMKDGLTFMYKGDFRAPYDDAVIG